MTDTFEDTGYIGAPCVVAYIDGENDFNYNTNGRHRRDTAWTIAYCLLAALTLAGSIPVFLRTDPHTGLYSNRFFNNSTSCDARRYQQVAGIYNDSTYDPTFLRRFKAEATIWIPVTAGLSLLWSALNLLLFCLFTRATLATGVLGSLLLGTGLSAMCFTIAHSFPLGITLAAVIAVTTALFFFVGRWARALFELLTAAAHSLRRNPWLVPSALGMKIAGLLVLAYGFSAFFSAVNHGFVSRNWGAAQRFAVADENGFCLNAANKHIPCCIFVTHSWAYAYAAAAAVFVIWSGGLVMQLKTFAAADTLTQWYFTTGAGSASTFISIGAVPVQAVSSIQRETSSAARVRRALQHCVMTSFGTLAAGGALLVPLRAIRWTSQGLLHTRYIGRAANCILRPIVSASDKFTRFTSIAAAVTGQAFIPAARAVFDLLQINFLPPYSLWWVPNTLLDVTSALLALCWAAVVFIVTYTTNKQYKPVVMNVSLAAAAVAFFLMLYGLLFTAGLQMDVVHSLYICYAMDQQQRRTTHPSIHSVLRKVPGQSVQHHQSALAYRAPGTSQSGEATWEMPGLVEAASGAEPVAAATATGRQTATAEAAPLPALSGDDIIGDSEIMPERVSFSVASVPRLKRRAL
ncbi:hypothetical protein VaNZ11_001067 [Volvox africanus]|uniref:Choline transporter-like protein n=1 Tax=Volvox africanus TaxID=51714 RepID=A0ABQ5RPI9_9CHLO|nr:hypothetical protein VaNZ11_001067 [Volvox africanus]